MRVLLYSHAFAPAIGGTETIVARLAEGLTRRGVDVTVATPMPRGGMEGAELPFPVVRQPRLPSLARLIRQSELVHLAGPALVPLALGLLLGRPVVVEHHGFQAICPNGQLFHEPSRSECPGFFMAGHHAECLRCNVAQGRVASLKLWCSTSLRRRLCRKAAANITPTDWLATLLRLPRMTTILHGLSGIEPAASAAAASPFVFSFAGRLVSTKGTNVLLDAAAQLHSEGLSFRIDLIGDGPSRAELESTVRQHGLQDVVRFRGWLSSAELQQALEATGALVVPSLAGEVFGLASLENMFRGKPVIASRIGSLTEVLGDAGLTFPPGDAVALARCMRQVIENPKIAGELGQRGRERAWSLFRQDQMIDRHLRLYHAVLSENVGTATAGKPQSHFAVQATEDVAQAQMGGSEAISGNGSGSQHSNRGET